MSIKTDSWPINVAWTDIFYVQDAYGNAVTGLTNGSFTKTLYKDDASSAQAVTITEIAGGLYYASFTPNATGDWYLLVSHTTYGKWASNLYARSRSTDDLAYPAVSGRSFAVDASGNVAGDLKLWLASAPAALSSSYVQVDLRRWQTSSPATLTASGYVQSDLESWVGGVPNALQTGRVDSYTGAIASGVAAADVWNATRATYTTSGSFGELGVPIIRTGTCQAGSAGSTIVLDAGASATNDFYTYMKVQIKSGTGAGCCQFISSYNGTTKTATVSPGWITPPDATSVFVITSTSIEGIDWNVIANPSVSKSLSNTAIGSVIGSVGSVTGNVGGNVTGSVGSVTGNVGGNVTGSVGSLGATAKTDVENSVWNASQASHVTAGTFGLYLDTTVSSRLATSGYTAPLSAAATANAVWDESILTHTTVNTFGKQLGTFAFNGSYALVDLFLWAGSVPANLNTGGYVQVDVERWKGTGTPNALISGRVDANAQVVGDKTGYALTSGERTSIATSVWSLTNAIDGTITPDKALTYIFATTAGVSAGEPAGANDTFAGPSGVTRVTTTYDVSNNRTAVVLA